MPAPLLELRDLQVEFHVDDAWARAVDGVSLTIAAGETLCLVGESGCGKSVTALSIARLLPTPPARYTGGHVLVEGLDTLAMSDKELRSVRGGTVSYIFQEPGASLNPVMRIRDQIKEARISTDRSARTTPKWSGFSSSSGSRLPRAGCGTIRTSSAAGCSSA